MSMSKLLKRFVLGSAFVLTLCTTSLTAYAGDGGTGGSGSGGQSGGASSYLPHTYGITFKLVPRDEYLGKGSVNLNSSIHYQKHNPGLTVMFWDSSNGGGLVTGGFKEVLGTTDLATRSARFLSYAEMQNLFGNKASTIYNGIKGMTSSNLSNNNPIMHMERVSTALNNALSDGKGNTMLYDTKSRREFYRKFKSYCPNITMTEKDFMSKTGVIVAEPVIGFTSTPAGYNMFHTFGQAERIRYHGLDKSHALYQKRYSIRGKVFSGGKSVCGASMRQCGLYRNVVDIDQKDISNVQRIDDATLKKWVYKDRYNSNLRKYGTHVYGLEWGGGSKGATNLTVRATQNADGSYTMDSQASTISQAAGNMPYDKNLNNGAGKIDGLTGGNSDCSNHGTPSVVSNFIASYCEGYKTWSSGAFLLKGTGEYTAETTVRNYKKKYEGNQGSEKVTVSTGDFNAGFNYKPKYKVNTPQNAARDFAKTTFKNGNLSKQIRQDFVNFKNPVNVLYNLTAIANNESSIGATELKANKDWDTAGQGKITLDGDSSSVGMAVEYLYKPKPIKSFISYAKLTYDNKMSGKLEYGYNCSSKDHTLVDSAHFDIEGNRYLIAFVPNANATNMQLSDSNKCGGTFWETVKGNIKDGDVYDITDFRRDISQNVCNQSTVNEGYVHGATASVGGKDGKGYSIFVLEIVNPSTINVVTNAKLDDYQLNSITLDILAPTKGRLVNSSEVISGGKSGTVACGFNRDTAEKLTHDKFIKDDSLYRLASNGNQTGITVSSHRKNSNMIYYNTLVGNAYTFNEVEGAVPNISTKDAKNYTYAWNLARGLYGDVRAISPLSRNSISDSLYKKVTEQYKAEYNLKPSKVEEVKEKRNSLAKYYDKVGDKISFASRWEKSGLAPMGVAHKVHSKQVYNTKWKENEYRTCTYEVLGQSGARPLKYKGLSIYGLNIDVHETIYKYSTIAMETGRNKTANGKTTGGVNTPNVNINGGSVLASHKFDTNGLNRTDSRLGAEYRMAVTSNLVKGDTPVELKFYPEVRMRAYTVDGERISQGSIIPNTVLTMGEKVRKVQPSSLYFVRVEQTEGKQATGELFSDTMGTGTNAGNLSSENGNKPVIYGGSDVTLNVKGKYGIKMYGYALDLINYDKDKNGLKQSANSMRPYKEIVNDTGTYKDPYTTWGNGVGTGDNESTKLLFKQYKDWVSSVKDSLYADITLKVQGDGVDKTFNNFNVSMAQAKDVASHEDGVFNIYVRRGEIDTEGAGYKALINQIKADYKCTESEAKELFKASDIYQSIVKAVEDTKDSFNKSVNVNTSENGAHAVRQEETNDNWYDEEVKTFVVRRYYSEPLKTEDIILSDKIDYNLSPDSTVGESNDTNAMQHSYDSAEAKWYLTLYFRDNATVTGENHKDNLNLYITAGELFNPKDGLVKENANYYKGGNVLINNLYIDGADFLVPSATTSDMLK